MRSALLLPVSLSLLLGGCGEKSSPEGSKSTGDNQTAPSEEVKPKLEYEIKSDEVTITDCNEAVTGELIIPDTIEGNPVTSIGDGAFRFCKSLTNITIPDSVTSIGEDAFERCTSLTTIEVGAGNVNYTGVNGVLFNKKKTTLCIYPAAKTGANYVIPDSVTSIRAGAFGICRSLTTITIPDGVTSIGKGAFCLCSSLTSITIPDSVSSIGDGTFGGCSSLRSITIPDSVTSIVDSAFGGCSSLRSITIPDSVTSIGDGAFGYCRSLTAVTFLGDAPKVAENPIREASNPFREASPTIYRKPEAKGWGDTFTGRPVKLISEKP